MLSNIKAKKVMKTTVVKLRSQITVIMTRKRDTVMKPKIPVMTITKSMKHGDLLTESIG